MDSTRMQELSEVHSIQTMLLQGIYQTVNYPFKAYSIRERGDHLRVFSKYQIANFSR